MSPTTKYASLTPNVLSTNKFKRGKDRSLSPDSSGKQMYNSFRKFNPGQYEENSPEWQVAMLQYLLDMKNHGHKVQEVSVDKVITITTYGLFHIPINNKKYPIAIGFLISATRNIIQRVCIHWTSCRI